MYGRETKNSGAKNPQIQPTPTQSRAKVGSGVASRGDSDAAAQLMLPFVLIIAVALYFVWAILEQHQKIKTALEPKAIGINLRNLAVIMVTVVLGLNLFKIAAVKISLLVSWLSKGRFRARWLVYLAGGA
jgi:hypothetical protein